VSMLSFSSTILLASPPSRVWKPFARGKCKQPAGVAVWLGQNSFPPSCPLCRGMGYSVPCKAIVWGKLESLRNVDCLAPSGRSYPVTWPLPPMKWAEWSNPLSPR
jgi:hypothetical protein